MPSLNLDAAARALLRAVDPSTQFPSRTEIKFIQDVDNGRSPRLLSSMTQDSAQERLADNEREVFRSIDRTILGLRTDWDLNAVPSQTFVTRQVMETIRTRSTLKALFGPKFKPLGPFVAKKIPEATTEAVLPDIGIKGSEATKEEETTAQKSSVSASSSSSSTSQSSRSSSSSSSEEDEEEEEELKQDVTRFASPFYERAARILPFDLGSSSSSRVATLRSWCHFMGP